MKMAKKFLAVALAGVLALSVLTGCGDSANTKSIAEAMSDMVKVADITVKEKSELNTKAKAIVEALVNADEAEPEALAENGPTETEGIPTEEQKAKIMDIMGPSYSNQFVWVSVTETKGYNATAQASNLLNVMWEGRVNAPTGKDFDNTWYIGTTTFTQGDTTYRFAVITAAAKAEQTPGGGESTDQGSKE